MWDLLCKALSTIRIFLCSQNCVRECCGDGVLETFISMLQVAAMQGMILVQQWMLSIGNLISCWYFSQPWRFPLQNRTLVTVISGYLTLQTKALLVLQPRKEFYRVHVYSWERLPQPIRLQNESTLSVPCRVIHCTLSIAFQNTVLTAQKVLMVDENQSLRQWTPHNKHHCQTNKFVSTVCRINCMSSVSILIHTVISILKSIVLFSGYYYCWSWISKAGANSGWS